MALDPKTRAGITTTSSKSLFESPDKYVGNPPTKLDELNNNCICERKPTAIYCCSCDQYYFGRLLKTCTVHPKVKFLLDINSCSKCKKFEYLFEIDDCSFEEFKRIPHVPKDVEFMDL